MNEWKLIATDVCFTHQLPEHNSFVGDSYQCSYCHNRVASRKAGTDLPKICPWCGEQMKGANDEVD